MARIFTHINPDLDAHSSCWAVIRFVPGMSNAVIIYIGADWDGSGMEPGDIAVDLNAGGKGIKGILDPDGTVHSSFAYIVSRYASREDAEAIRDLVSFVDIQDANGSFVNYMVKKRMIMETNHDVRRLIAVNGIGSTLLAFENRFPNDPEKVFSRMCEIFDGRLEMGGVAERRAKIEAERAELFANGRVALVRGKKEKRTSHILWERGVQALVYVDGFNLGVVRRGEGALLRDGRRFRADHPDILKIIRESGDKPWYAHPTGFACMYGSRKAPKYSMSNVPPRQLVGVVAELHK